MSRGDDLLTADAVVVGGFREKDGGGAQGTDGDVGGTAADALVDSVAGAFERAGLSVGRASGRAARHRRQLADALFAAVRDGVRQDVNRPRRPKVVAIVGLGGESGSFREASLASDFLEDAQLRWRVRHFTMRGGVVLVHGRGGAIDSLMHDWFAKPWTSGLTRKNVTWTYNDRSAWGGGYFGRYNASAAHGSGGAPTRLELRTVVELERVRPAERVFAAIAKEMGTAVALGTYGGGHVGYFGDADADEASLAVVAALAEAAPGVGSAEGARRLRASPLASIGVVDPEVWTDDRDVPKGGDGGRVRKPSVAAFACYAATTLAITVAFAAGSAKLILMS